MKLIDITGNTYGCLLVIKRQGVNSVNQVKWLCLCECGKECIITGRDLKSGHTKSCGCYKDKILRTRFVKHGMHKTTEYRIWSLMKYRCYNRKCKQYKYYGGVGIKVCDRWINSFENFISDMGLRPTNKHTLDRFPNQRGDYEASNCRWATMKEQCRNRKSNVWITYNKETKLINDWALQFKSNIGNIRRMMQNKSFDEVFKHYMK